MPTSPADATDLAVAVGQVYQDAENALLERLARAVADGIDAPDWVTAKARALGNLITGVQEITAALRDDADGAIASAVRQAYSRGRQAAVAELGLLSEGTRAAADDALPNARAVDRLAAEAVAATRPLYLRILRGIPDVYQTISQRIAGGVLLGVMTRRQAAQRALDQYAAKGITGFTDRAGRNWDMASYAEMAARTVTGRAAITGHADRLEELGQNLVIVSSAPLDCPLCQPWDGEVLTLGGPAGSRTISAEHATQDGRTVNVHVAGSLEEARASGLFHCNCRHNVSAYLPGLTRRPETPPHPGGATYEDTQQQRYLERQVRMWKRRASVAMDDAGRTAANARVRDYQSRIRQLTADKQLSRRSTREQLLTGTVRPAVPLNAARVRVGDATVRRMSDEELGAAIASGHLTSADHATVEAEADRRDHEQLLDRIRPSGRLAADLTGFSDDELGRALPDLTSDQALTVAAEMDRRDTAAGLPGARADLIGLSDHQLGERARHATGDELAALAVEADRREMLGRVFPDGRLATDLSGLDDDTLGWAVRYADPAGAERIAAEIDRRHPIVLPAARGAATVAGQLADRAALDQVLAPLAPVEDWAHLAAPADEHDALDAAARWLADKEAAELANKGAYSREQIRELYAEHVYAQWLDAEDWCRGYLLTKQAEHDGVDPRSLFSGPSHVAYTRASEELRRYWSEVAPRLTLAEYSEQLTGLRSAAADTARKAKSDQHNRF
ncbi:phage minor capsid protein [Kitasatospora viridis]|uniref:Minor capsid protein 2 n=1 Tax=Kitasatospora viridis TaxID=281105 RepID=A0A561UKM8_9ACTN|nr:phage minor capsid protein [Kitasatospora viridis]TWF99921.1 minor capsid protein 2 [Kitasatospora viridis]